MNPQEIIARFMDTHSFVYDVLMTHSAQVAAQAMQIVRRNPHLEIDHVFVWEAAWLHDVGIVAVDAPQIGCYGTAPYLAHGQRGRELLDSLGLSRHALVCERHVGMGLTAAEIVAQGLPLVPRDCVPQSLEEQVVCLADKFFSKGVPDQSPRSLAHVRAQVERWGARSVAALETYVDRFLKETGGGLS